MDWVTTWGYITTAICLIGIFLAMQRVAMLGRDGSVVSGRLIAIDFTHILIYGATAFFGLATAAGIDLDSVLYPARALFFLSNVIFSYRLLKPIS